MIDQLAVWAEIGRVFGEIGEPEVRRAQRQLGKVQPGEVALGVLHSEDLKKLWALAERFEGEAKQCAIDSIHKAETEEQAQESLERSHRLAALEEAVRDLFWLQAKDDAREWGRADGFMGLRENWMLIFTPMRHSPLAAILKHLTRPPE